MDMIPLEILFPATILLMALAIDLGYRVGNTHTIDSKKLKEKITSSNAASILSMLGFILVFAFSIVYNRYDTKKSLIREESNMIRTVWQRSDFLPMEDIPRAKNLIKKYVDLRIDAAKQTDSDEMQKAINESIVIQKQLWDMAVVNARRDMNSDVAALYIESLNEITNQQALRIIYGLQARIPALIWVLLFSLLFLGMFGTGYQTSVSNAGRRSWITPVFILSFSIMIVLIAALDRPQSKFLPVSQQPLVDLRTWLDTGSQTGN
jgi:hypothetical protein